MPPSTPQTPLRVPAWQKALALQQPAQLLESHLQMPPSQSWPLTQGLPVPQPQVPLERQLSAFTGSQLEQAPPAVPQAPVLCGSQIPS